MFERPSNSGTSYLFEFELSEEGAKHVASGEVEGSIQDRWSMDEHDGVLRVLVGPSSETGNFNSIVTLERQGDELVETGHLDQLGPNEQVQSVRWQDDIAHRRDIPPGRPAVRRRPARASRRCSRS